MSAEKFRTAIKSNRFLYYPLLPVARLFRWLRSAFQSKAAAIPTNPFRDYCSSLSKFVAEPVFVKVGANDGLTGDPCSDILLADRNWKGVLIEPVPYCFERLQANFGDATRFRLEQVAVGAVAGKATFYYVDRQAAKSLPGLPVWYDQIGSFDRQHIVKHLDGALEPFIIASDVEVAPLSAILARNGISDVHLLHIDTEGHDYEVLKTVDFANHPPVVIFVEHMHLPPAQKAEMLQLLTKHGYTIQDYGSDFFAIREAAYQRLRSQRRDRRRLASRVE